MRYFVISLPAMSNLRVKCGRANPSNTGQICVTPSPESTTTPVRRPEISQSHLLNSQCPKSQRVNHSVLRINDTVAL